MGYWLCSSPTLVFGETSWPCRILDSGQRLLIVGVVSPRPLWIRLIQGALLQAGWLSSPSSYGLGCPHGLPMPQKGELPQRSPRAMVFKPFIFISTTLSKEILCRLLNIQKRRAKLLWRKWDGAKCSLISPDPEASLRNSGALQVSAWNPWASKAQVRKPVICPR